MLKTLIAPQLAVVVMPTGNVGENNLQFIIIDHNGVYKRVNNTSS